MALDTWLAFLAAAAVLVLIPGPTVLLVVSYAVAQGRRVALAMAAGVALGDATAMTLSLAGLGALIAASAELFTLLRWVGAAYLVYLGVRLWRSPPAIADAAGAGSATAARVLAHAFAVTALNPKSIAFFVAFVPHFVDPARPLLPQFAILEASFVTLAAANALLYALAADRLGSRIRRPAVARWVNRTGGATLVGMGTATAVWSRG